MFCCTLLFVHSSNAIILMGKRELIALLDLSSWCLVMVERLFLAVPRGSLQFVIVVFPDYTHLLFLIWIIIICKGFKQTTQAGKDSPETTKCFKPSSKSILLTVPRRCFFCGSFCYLCLVFIMFSCLFIAVLWPPAGRALISWLS